MKTLLFLILLPIYSFASIIDFDFEIDSKHMKSEIPLEFERSAANLVQLFQDQISSKGANLHIRYELDSTTVNAYASREGNDWYITFKGGLISHRSIDLDIFNAILCHELGHHLAGAPFKFSVPNERSWVSVEGQSDYFAANICLKKILEHEDNESWVNTHKVSNLMKKGCQQKFMTSSAEYFLCLRSASISLKLGNFVTKIGQNRRGRREKKPKLETPSQVVRSSTMIQHPNAQCRLDTYFQGSICDSYYLGDLNCPNIWNDFSGARPRCWYAPSKL